MGTKMDFTCKSLELAECRSRGSQTSTEANVHYKNVFLNVVRPLQGVTEILNKNTCIYGGGGTIAVTEKLGKGGKIKA